MFVDESGSDGLDLSKPGVSACYVLAAVVVDADSLDDTNAHFEEVRKRHFQGPEMSSRLIGGSDSRRKLVVEDLLGADFSLFFLVVRKAELRSPGFAYSRPFIEYFLAMFVSRVLSDADKASLVSDRIKTQGFQEDVRRYLTKRFPRSLFSACELSFVDSKTNPAVQAADVFAGTVGRCWERPRPTSHSAALLDTMRDRILLYEVFPQPRDVITTSPLLHVPRMHDSRIRALAIRSAEDLASSIAHSTETKHIQEHSVLVELLAFNHLEGPDEWLPGPELRERCLKRPGAPLSHRAFLGTVGRLRDAGVLIATKAEGGYKLATSEDDLHRFVESQGAKIGPMLRRVRIARDAVRRVTNGRVDILSPRQYQSLLRAIEATQTWELPERRERGDQQSRQARGDTAWGERSGHAGRHLAVAPQ